MNPRKVGEETPGFFPAFLPILKESKREYH